MGGVGANVWTTRPSSVGVAAVSGAFEYARCAAGAVIETFHGTFQPGSSKQGNALHALVASNCEYRYQWLESSWRNRPAMLREVTWPVNSRTSWWAPASIAAGAAN